MRRICLIRADDFCGDAAFFLAMIGCYYNLLPVFKSSNTTLNQSVIDAPAKKAQMPVFTAFSWIWDLTFVGGGVIKRLNTKGESYG